VNSRERVAAALAHRQPDRVPLDLGASAVTGMHVSSVYRLRQALRLDPPGTPVKVVEPYQMLGEVGADLMDALGVDVVGLVRRSTFFGFTTTGWKPWRFHPGSSDETPVAVPGGFNTEPEPDGSLLLYPEGDRSAPPSGRMPSGGYYFDSIVRQPPIDEARLDPADNMEEFTPITEAELAEIEEDLEAAEATGRAVFANFGGTSFGDISMVPAPWMKHPRGIRDIEEWYVSTVTRRDYIWKVFERQCEVALANLERIHRRVGERPAVAFMSGTDFGAQAGPFISPEAYRDLFKPFNKALNDWVHQHTSWKTFIHSCGSVIRLIPDFIDAGFDILNPVQTSAAGMDLAELKRRFGDRLVFWGGGVDTQHVLPFGTPEEVREDVRGRIATLAPGGGVIFNTIHNVQAKVPVENLRALYQAVKDFGGY
jgi:hypothetical protein